LVPGYPGVPTERLIQENAARRIDMTKQLMDLFGAYDAQSQNLAARNDPTIPALLNTQLASYANMMSGGGQNANDFLSGNYGQGGGSQVPVTFNQGNGSPFDIAAQHPQGINSTISSMFQNLISPTVLDQSQNLADILFTMGPSWGAYPNQRPSPGLSADNYDQLLSSLGIGQQVPRYATGTPYVPQTGPAILHQGEAVLPAQQNPFAPMAQQQFAKGTPTMQTLGAPQPAGAITLPAPPPAPAPQAPQTPVASPPAAGPMNPLQQAIQSLQGQLGSGGPINANVQNILNQQLADQTGQAYQQQLQQLNASLGARGLGDSGLQFGLQQTLQDMLNSNRVQGRNQIALNAANTNWGALQQGAGNLANTALGAGQFGLQQQAQQQNQQNQMFQMLMDAIQRSRANPSDLFGSSVTISPTTAAA
jgi:hypothetical protein